MSSDPDPAVIARLRSAGCVFAEEEAGLLAAAARTPADLAALVELRVAGLPLEQVVGWAEFCGLRIVVDPGVFVPRRRTELLAREAIAAATPSAVVVDLCCGSGAVGAAVFAARPHIELYAADIDPAAVACARRNLPGARVYAGDLYSPLPVALTGRVDVVIANGPYVPTDEIALLPAEARLHEPRVALDGGPDGLDVLRRVIADAPRWLAPRGHVLVESTRDQAPHLVAAVRRAGLSPRVSDCVESEATVVIGTREARR
jgi:release factor glutamine methyltransferase